MKYLYNIDCNTPLVPIISLTDIRQIFSVPHYVKKVMEPNKQGEICAYEDAN